VATDTGGQTGTTGSQEAIATDPIFQDIDGDGYVDIVMPYSAYFRDDSLGFDPNASSNLIGGYHLYLNTSMSGTLGFGNSIGFLETATQDPTSLFMNPTMPPRDATIAIGDTDGDGYPEIIRMAATNNAVTNMPSNCVATLNGQSSGAGAALCLWSSNQALATASFPPTNSPPASHTTAHAAPSYSYLTCTDPNCNGTNTALSNAVTFPDGSTSFAKFSAIDLDGDGLAEVMREEQSGTTTVNSPTWFNAVIPTMPTVSPYVPTMTWADVNGDGLPDAVTITPPWLSDPGNNQQPIVEEATIAVAINTGVGFAAPVTTTLPRSLAFFGTGMGNFGIQTVPGDLSIRVMDVNLDGRQDLLFTAVYYAGVNYTVIPESHQQVLLSNGDGTFTQQSTTIAAANLSNPFLPPEKNATTGLIEPAGNNGNFGGSVHAPWESVVADLNGDGLPDVVEMDAITGPCTGLLINEVCPCASQAGGCPPGNEPP